MKSRTTVALLLPLALACGDAGPEGPIVGPIGPEVVEGPLTRTPIHFTTTDDSIPKQTLEAEHGRLRVPERHDDPQGREIVVRYVRFPSTSPDPDPPIVYLAGGPGGSGTWSASGDRFHLFQRLRGVADVIAYDKRGTWGTEPYMVCPGSWSLPLDRPLSEAAMLEAKRPFLDECYRHWQERAELSAYNTVEAVEDLEALRRALGADKLTLWGISYGTHLGLAYIRAYPDRVHRAVLAGVEGPDDTYKLPARIDAVFRRISDEIAADPRAGSLLPDLVGSVKELLEELERAPIKVEVPHPGSAKKVEVVLGPDDLRRAAYAAMGERDEIERLGAGAAQVLEGDWSQVALAAIRSRSENRDLVMALSMDCASGVSLERRAEIQAQAREAVLGDVVNARLRTSCASWPVEDLGPGFRAPVRGEMPILVLSGSFDPRTPVENGQDVLDGFPNGHHLILERGSHDDDLFLSSPAIADAIEAFLRGQAVPERIELPPLNFGPLAPPRGADGWSR